MEQLYIYKLSQQENEGYDTYDSCIVIAKNKEEAKKIHASKAHNLQTESHNPWKKESYPVWASKPENVTVKLIGIANQEQKEGDIVLASFNAG